MTYLTMTAGLIVIMGFLPAHAMDGNQKFMDDSLDRCISSNGESTLPISDVSQSLSPVKKEPNPLTIPFLSINPIIIEPGQSLPLPKSGDPDFLKVYSSPYMLTEFDWPTSGLQLSFNKTDWGNHY